MTKSEIPDVEATFTVRGAPAQVSAFRNLLTAIESWCQGGASRYLEISVDGDGATQLAITENGKPLGDGLSANEEEFYIWPHLRPSTAEDMPACLRDYSMSWRVEPTGKRTLVFELDGCGPLEDGG